MVERDPDRLQYWTSFEASRVRRDNRDNILLQELGDDDTLRMNETENPIERIHGPGPEKQIKSNDHLQGLENLYLSMYGNSKKPRESIREFLARESIGKRKEPKSIRLENVLKLLPTSMGELKESKSLDLSGCQNLEKLWESIGELHKLLYLDLSSCGSLEKLPESMGELKELKSINLSMCLKLETLPQSIGELKKLIYLNLSSCGRLEKLPESMGGLKELRSLNLSMCQSLEKLPESMGELKKLKSLNLSMCQSLKKLPESMGELKQLKSLNLCGCWSLKKLPKSSRELKELKSLGVEKMLNISHVKNLCEYESWQQFTLSLDDGDDGFKGSSESEILSLENSTMNQERPSRMFDWVSLDLMDILQQEMVQDMSEHLSMKWGKLLKAPSSAIKRVFEFLGTTTDLQSRKGSARILCNMSASGRALEFQFEDAKSMSKVVGIGIKNSKVILTRNLETLVVFKSYFENRWEANLAKTLTEESIYDDLLVMFPDVDVEKNKELQYSVLSSREFGVGFTGSKETNIGIFFNTRDSTMYTTEVIPLLWEVSKHFLLKRINQFSGKKEGSYLSNSGNSNGGGSGSENDNSLHSSPTSECNNQLKARISSGRIQTTPGDNGDYTDDGDEDKRLNPARNANEKENWNEEQEKSASVTLIFVGGVGELASANGLRAPSCLEHFARIYPKIKFQFFKKSLHERKIKIGSNVEFELSKAAQPTLHPSNYEFGWLHDSLAISMKCMEEKAASLDLDYGLLDDFDGKPLVEVGKDIETTNCTYQRSKTAELGTEMGGSVKVLPVTNANMKSSWKTTNAHQDTNGKQKSSETSTTSNLPAGFTCRNTSNRRLGHLEYDIMFPKPLCREISDSTILWCDHEDRMSIMRSGRCLPFNATLQGTWRIHHQQNNQEQAMYFFECSRELTKLHRESEPQRRRYGGTAQNGYSEEKFDQRFLFKFFVNHAMTHLHSISGSSQIEIHEGGKKVDVPNVITEI